MSGRTAGRDCTGVVLTPSPTFEAVCKHSLEADYKPTGPSSMHARGSNYEILAQVTAKSTNILHMTNCHPVPPHPDPGVSSTRGRIFRFAQQ